MSATYDERPGFFCGCQTSGFVEMSGKRRRPWAGVIQRKFVSWDEIERRKFRTEQEAGSWVSERLRQLDEWGSDRDRRFVSKSRAGSPAAGPMAQPEGEHP